MKQTIMHRARKVLYLQAKKDLSGYGRLSIEKILAHLSDLIPVPSTTQEEKDRLVAENFFFGVDSDIDIFSGCAGIDTLWLQDIASRIKVGTHRISGDPNVQCTG